MLKQSLIGLVVLGLTAPMASGQATSNRRALPDFDIREQQSVGASLAEHTQANQLVQSRMSNLASFISSDQQLRLGSRVVPNDFGLPKLFLRDGRTLTAASDLKPSETAKSFLRSEAGLFALNNTEVDRLRLVVEDVTENAKFLAFNQTLGGIDVFNGQLKFTMNKNGEIVQVATGDLVPGVNISTTPQLRAEEAVKAAFAMIRKPQSAALSAVTDANGKTAFQNSNGKGFSPITADLFIFPMTASSARLAYRISLEVDDATWYEMLIDANDGTLLYRHNLYVFAAQARVWTESPMVGTRTLVPFPAPSTMDPEGWLPATATVTTGNNVDAYLDANGDDRPDTTTDPNMSNGRALSATQNFDFDFGDGTLNLDPRLFAPAAVTNLFYLVNIAHDYYYGIGFNEANGNFQTNNFGKGGVGNDAVVAEAQYGRFTNNAAFAPTVEGVAPKVRMGLFTRNTSSKLDDLDTDYDGMVLVHEYGHGVSNRLVGAKNSTSCLNRIQSGAMGEGWSDYFASSFFNNPVQGAYIGQNSTRGIRRYSYEGYPLTYEDIGTGSNGYEVHDDGEIWVGTLWDLRKSLGAAVTDKLVIDGLKATPCNPSMTDARDAILSADQATNSGANRTAIWTVFARHGMGFSALGIDGTSITGTRYDAAYDLPADLQPNRNPAITSNPIFRVGVGDTYSYNIVASNPQGGTLNYVLSNGPAAMTVDPASGAVRWPTEFISTRIKITITDGKGGKVVHGYFLPVMTTLASGKTITISAALSTIGLATITVPAGVPVLQIKLRGGSGDSDLLVATPTGVSAISVQDGTAETLSFANPPAGDWQIQVRAFQAYTGVSLTASLITPTVLSPNTSISNVSGEFTSETFYRVTVPPGVASLTVSTSGGAGDVDVIVRKGAPAVCQPFDAVFGDCLFDQVSGNEGTAESIILTNPASGDLYIDLIAYEDYSGVKLDIATAMPALTLSSTGAVTTTTLGRAAGVTAGYATADVQSGTAPYGTAVFSLSQNGVVVSEAGVPASPPVQSARIFIDYRTAVAAGNGSIDIFTGLAMANRGTSSASLTYTLRDRSGQTLATGHGTLPQGAHRAKFIQQLVDIAPDFVIPPNFSTSILYGSLEISSSQPVSVLGLRLTNNQRGETLLTSTVVADLSRPASASPLYFPQLADGGGYTTTVILSNTSGSAESGTISVMDDNGAALSVRQAGGSTGSSFNYSIPAAGTFVFQTDGSPAATRIGWIKVTPNSGNNTPAGAGVFSYSPAGILVTESGIPSSVPATRARLFVDKSNGHDTGLALGNPGSTALNVTIQAFQTSGANAGSGSATINIPANGHHADFVGNLIAGLPAGFTGIADLTSSSPFVPLTLRSLTNGRGDFLLTTFPAPDVTQPAPTPIVFPQIADGGGYTTQFIFISANGAASVSVNFIGDDGTPLNIERN